MLLVVTPTSPSSAITDYAARWGIETLFGIFKTRGFCLESTHFTDSERLSKLLALLTIALCWAFRTGQWLHEIKPLKLKKHGRKAKSIFRYGFDHLRRIVLNLEQEADGFLNRYCQINWTQAATSTIFLNKQSPFPYADTLTLTISRQICIRFTIMLLLLKAGKQCL